MGTLIAQKFFQSLAMTLEPPVKPNEVYGPRDSYELLRSPELENSSQFRWNEDEDAPPNNLKWLWLSVSESRRHKQCTQMFLLLSYSHNTVLRVRCNSPILCTRKLGCATKTTVKSDNARQYTEAMISWQWNEGVLWQAIMILRNVRAMWGNRIHDSCDNVCGLQVTGVVKVRV